MAWRRKGDKLLSEPMLTRFTDGTMGRWVKWISEEPARSSRHVTKRCSQIIMECVPSDHLPYNFIKVTYSRLEISSGMCKSFDIDLNSMIGYLCISLCTVCQAVFSMNRDDEKFALIVIRNDLHMWHQVFGIFLLVWNVCIKIWIG